MTEETSDNPKDLFAALTKQMALMDSELHVQQNRPSMSKTGSTRKFQVDPNQTTVAALMSSYSRPTVSSSRKGSSTNLLQGPIVPFNPLLSPQHNSSTENESFKALLKLVNIETINPESYEDELERNQETYATLIHGKMPSNENNSVSDSSSSSSKHGTRSNTQRNKTKSKNLAEDRDLPDYAENFLHPGNINKQKREKYNIFAGVDPLKMQQALQKNQLKFSESVHQRDEEIRRKERLRNRKNSYQSSISTRIEDLDAFYPLGEGDEKEEDSEVDDEKSIDKDGQNSKRKKQTKSTSENHLKSTSIWSQNGDFDLMNASSGNPSESLDEDQQRMNRSVMTDSDHTDARDGHHRGVDDPKKGFPRRLSDHSVFNISFQGSNINQQTVNTEISLSRSQLMNDFLRYESPDDPQTILRYLNIYNKLSAGRTITLDDFINSQPREQSHTRESRVMSPLKSFERPLAHPVDQHVYSHHTSDNIIKQLTLEQRSQGIHSVDINQESWDERNVIDLTTHTSNRPISRTLSAMSSLMDLSRSYHGPNSQPTTATSSFIDIRLPTRTSTSKMDIQRGKWTQRRDPKPQKLKPITSHHVDPFIDTPMKSSRRGIKGNKFSRNALSSPSNAALYEADPVPQEFMTIHSHSQTRLRSPGKASNKDRHGISHPIESIEVKPEPSMTSDSDKPFASTVSLMSSKTSMRIPLPLPLPLILPLTASGDLIRSDSSKITDRDSLHQAAGQYEEDEDKAKDKDEDGTSQSLEENALNGSDPRDSPEINKASRKHLIPSFADIDQIADRIGDALIVDKESYIQPASAYNDTGYPMTSVAPNHDTFAPPIVEGAILGPNIYKLPEIVDKMPKESQRRQYKSPEQSLLDLLNELKRKYADESSHEGIASSSHNIKGLEDSLQPTRSLSFHMSQQSGKVDTKAIHKTSSEKISSSSLLPPPVMEYQAHNRILGWKLTSRKRRKQLVGLLDMLHKGQGNDITHGNLIIQTALKLDKPINSEMKMKGKDTMSAMTIRPDETDQYRQLACQLIQEGILPEELLDPKLLDQLYLTRQDREKDQDKDGDKTGHDKSNDSEEGALMDKCMSLSKKLVVQSERERISWEQDVIRHRSARSVRHDITKLANKMQTSLLSSPSELLQTRLSSDWTHDIEKVDRMDILLAAQTLPPMLPEPLQREYARSIANIEDIHANMDQTRMKSSTLMSTLGYDLTENTPLSEEEGELLHRHKKWYGQEMSLQPLNDIVS